ncbi:MAG: hypothetical protein EXR69_04450 [Myxococcales bacterium]|nr:hypothetical protein [Myxococcales bacterium]
MSARALLIGLDGATWDVIEPLREALPNLWRLRSEGTWARLNSTTPPMTLPAWSSILTGCRPETHGIVDFVRREHGSYSLSFLNAEHRRVPTVHRILSGAGHRVASVAVPTTFPPESLNGLVIAGFDSPVATAASRGHCAPESEWGPIRARFGGLRFADFQEGKLGAGWHRHARASLLREIGRKEALCMHLLEREDWELFMVVFGESDTVGHHFWMLHDAASPRYAAALSLADYPLVRDTLVRVYSRLDGVVGRLQERATITGIVSDHGFGGANDMALYVNRFLEAEGWLRFASGSRESRLGDTLRRRALSVRGVEHVVRRAPSAWLGRAETLTRYGAIDFHSTRAWSDEMNYAATVHLNVKGRDPNGTIENVPLAVEALSAALRSWTVEGSHVVADVVVNPAARHGAADLTLQLATPGGYSYTLLPSVRVPAGTTWRRLDRAEQIGGKGLGTNGAHRQQGIMAFRGPGFPSGEVVAGVEDVAPTLLAALGHAVPAHMEGRVLTGGADGALRTADGAGQSTIGRVAHPQRSALADGRALERRLQSLGYL